MAEYFWSVLESDLIEIPNFIKNGFKYVNEYCFYFTRQLCIFLISILCFYCDTACVALEML